MVYILFLFSPLASLIMSMGRDQDRQHFKNILWIFIVLWGWALVVLPTDTGDQVQYLQYFQLTEGKPFAEFVSIYSFVLNSNGEIFSRFILWLVGQFTSDYHCLFALLAALYGFFYSRVIAYVMEAGLTKFHSWGFVFAAMSQVCFWYFMVFDFYFAGLIWVYSAIKIFNSSKPLKYYFLVVLTVFIHSSFVFPVVALFIGSYLFSKVFKKIDINRYMFFALSLGLLSIFSRPILLIVLKTISPFLASQYESYLTSDQIKETGGLYFYLLKTGAVILFLWIIMSYKTHLQQSSRKSPILRFALLFHGFCMLFYFLPSLNRYTSLSMFFLLIVVSQYFPRDGKSVPLNLFSMYSVFLFLFMLLTYGIQGIAYEWIIWGPFLTFTLVQTTTRMTGLYNWFN